jgi:glutamine---fructose-6-phosphate transaminase (isomerizing)
VKRQPGIGLNILGINPMENIDFKVGYMGVESDFEKKRICSLAPARQLKLFRGVGGAVPSTPWYINGSILDMMGSFVSRSVMPHRDYSHLYDYFQRNEGEINHLLLNEYDWESAVDTDSAWCIGDGTAVCYNYIYFTVGASRSTTPSGVIKFEKA